MYGQDRPRDMADFMPEPEFRPGLISFKDPLELKDQHLVALSNTNGFLAGRNAELEKTVYRLEERNRKLEAEVTELREDNKRYEISERQAQAGYKSGSQLVDEIEKALQKKLEVKE